MMDPMDDLAQFLRDRLDEDEQAARAWPDHQQNWEARGPRHLSYASGSGESVTAVNVGGDGALGWERIYVKRDPGDLAEHVARHDPARVLAEVNAKRRLLDLHAPGTQEYVDGDVCMSCTLTGDGPYYPCTTLRLLALPYANHPGYRDDWRP
ncbi:DUF6221 family protein [Streptomyces sp. NPDC060209]|uniref:DUF6221 family protein n=1 Tax=Streptomyces sp. NPDC060209 TaxID=3347073 RepID=UPI003669221C